MSTSTSNEAATAALTMTGVNLVEFTLFPELPFEIRSQIWKFAVVPRLVTPTPIFKDAIPAIYHACQESRAETKYVFHVKQTTSDATWSPNFKGPLIDWDADILFINQHFGRSQTWNPWWKFLDFGPIAREMPSLLNPVKRLALCLDTASWLCLAYTTALVLDGVNSEFEYHGGLGAYLEIVCPALQELVVVIRAGPLGSTIDDLWEDDGPYCEITRNYVDVIKFTLALVQAEERWKHLKFTIMRTERWLN